METTQRTYEYNYVRQRDTIHNTKTRNTKSDHSKNIIQARPGYKTATVDQIFNIVPLISKPKKK